MKIELNLSKTGLKQILALKPNHFPQFSLLEITKSHLTLTTGKSNIQSYTGATITKISRIKRWFGQFVLAHTDMLPQLCYTRNSKELKIPPGVSANAQYSFLRVSQLQSVVWASKTGGPKCSQLEEPTSSSQWTSFPHSSRVIPGWPCCTISFLITLHRSTNQRRQHYCGQ